MRPKQSLLYHITASLLPYTPQRTGDQEGRLKAFGVRGMLLLSRIDW